jgi:hypothetical protein
MREGGIRTSTSGAVTKAKGAVTRVGDVDLAAMEAPTGGRRREHA